MRGGRPSVMRAGLIGWMLLAAMPGACASSQSERETATLEPEVELQAVLTQPFNDFNLTRTEIPPELVQIRADPYAPPHRSSCTGITDEIVELDKLVGPDLEAVRSAGDRPIISEESATQAARNAARSAASSWIPFRGFVREVTGAERHARALKEAVLAGMVRRAYLKGLKEKFRCPPVTAATANSD